MNDEFIFNVNLRIDKSGRESAVNTTINLVRSERRTMKKRKATTVTIVGKKGKTRNIMMLMPRNETTVVRISCASCLA
ncbi:hypothetical protein LINPERHAP2_LOCUS36180 [Linum perenne]